jgi:N-acetylmuramoyl-L-alanine amidase/Bacterial Ig domain
MVAAALEGRYRHSVRLLAPFLLLSLALAQPAEGAQREGPIPFVAASRANYHASHRSARAIRLVVVHTIEGTYGGAIAWFRNPRARASANFVVARDGRITEMVAPWNVAWHAGNAWVNAHSLGIEHEGFAGIPWLYTDAEYRASARLVASLLRRSRLRADRAHVIGHAEVPDPYHRGQFGGYAHHTDPGRFWNWPRYMTYVRSYASGMEPPPLGFDVTVPTPTLMQRVADVVPWQAVPVGEATAHVDFLVDGALAGTTSADPWSLAWDSYAVPNGKHVLMARAVSYDGTEANASVLVVVRNVHIAITGSNLGDGDIVRGLVRVTATVQGRPDRVEFWVDGVLRDTQTAAPYVFEAWDASQEIDGEHALAIRAIRHDEIVASRSIRVVVVH